MTGPTETAIAEGVSGVSGVVEISEVTGALERLKVGVIGATEVRGGIAGRTGAGVEAGLVITGIGAVIGAGAGARTGTGSGNGAGGGNGVGAGGCGVADSGSLKAI